MTEREKLADEIERWVRRYQELEIAFHEATHNRGDVQAALEEFKAHRMGVASIMVAYFPTILAALRAPSPEPTAEEVERAAAALAHHHAEPPTLTPSEWWDGCEETHRELYRLDARAALLAARSRP